MWIEIKAPNIHVVVNSKKIVLFEVAIEALVEFNAVLRIKMEADNFLNIRFEKKESCVPFYNAIKIAVQGVSSDLGELGYVKVLLNDEMAAEASYLRRLEIINSLKGND